MKKILPVAVVLVACMLIVAPFSFSQYSGDYNVVDANGRRQGYWKITAGMMGPYIYGQYTQPKYDGWSPEQVVREGNYMNSEPAGTWIEYNNFGQKVTETIYDTTLNHALMKRFVDGVTIISLSNFIDGWHDGVERTFYPDGKLRSEYTWKNGRLNGPAKTYYPNGKLCEEGTWFHTYWDMTKPYSFFKK